MCTKMIDMAIFNGAMGKLTSKYLPIGGLENYFLRIFSNVKLENIFFWLILTGNIVKTSVHESKNV